jgi:GT2 family glycosyltransferase
VTSPAVTIAIVPREKYSCAPSSLRSLLANTGCSFDLVYIDGASPLKVRKELECILADIPHRMIRVDRYLGPFEAMSMAIEAATTPYLVVTDNDIHFRPGWFDALVACAVDENADVVSPLVLIGDEQSTTIHVAGGMAHIAGDDGARRICHHQQLEHRDYREPAVTLRREPTELVESHCLLARTETMRSLGTLDSTVGHSVNVEELSIRLARVGARVWFEPAAEVVYLFEKGMRLDRHDVALLNHVWSENWIDRDLAEQSLRHDLDRPSRDRRRQVRWWFADHRRVWLGRLERRVTTLGERAGLPGVAALVWKMLEAVEVVANRLLGMWTARFDARCRQSVGSPEIGRSSSIMGCREQMAR